IGARLAVPIFKDTASKPTDFNDLHGLEGLAAVEAQIHAAAAIKETDDETFERLSKLSPAEYDRSRESEPPRLQTRATTLDDEVEKRRERGPRAAGRKLQGFDIELPAVEHWPDPVDGPEVLAEVSGAYSRYIVLPPGAADASALWTAASHA